jgi:tRNA nucleotidyltransferase (CCA-adding enzyme)
MADYIYLLEHRLSAAQKDALSRVRTLARAKGLTVFLVGGAVRDLTSGSPVADLDVVVQGNALKLKKDLQLAGALLAGESDASQALFVRFPGGVRMEVGSTLTVTYPKPGKPVAKPGTILEDLRRRDFTANAMALSLNEGSYGLLMDPLNGVADIENRQLRLVSNYGFIEDPVRMVRAARLMSRLGWTLEEKTQTRYDTGRQEGYISALGEFQRGYELEEIVHEEEPLRVMRALEADGWLKILAPYWASTCANAVELDKLREVQTQLQMQGIHPDAAAAHFPLLTAKLSPKDTAQLKKSFPRQGFAAEIDSLEREAKEFAAQLSAKAAALPSQSWKTITSSNPEAVLWATYSTRSAPLQAKFKSFFTEWPPLRQKIPHLLMQEMRITPELAGYAELLDKLFFELLDGKLGTVEEMKAFLEPYSPPAPPPPVTVRRPRASKKEAKPVKSRLRKAVAAKADDGDDGDLDDADLEADNAAAIDLPILGDDDEDEEIATLHDDQDHEDEDDAPAEKPVKASAKAAAKTPVKAVSVKTPVKTVAKAAEKTPVKKVEKPPVKAAAKKAVKSAVKSATVKPLPATKAKIASGPAKKGLPAKKAAPVKKPVSAKKAAPAKKAAKKPVKAVKKPSAPVKAVAKKAAVSAKKAAPTRKARPAPPVKGRKR